MTTPHDKLTRLLRELFQFDSADLDFGIYRVMNMRRDAIDGFIREELVGLIQEELRTGALADQQEAVAELEELADEVHSTLGDSAISPDGALAETYEKTPLGRAYTATWERAQDAQPSGVLEALICNHLYAFFSRYYDSGDFISRRRYGRRERYAIPYNGEEVYLHWANRDQYYIKTGEHFSDYRYQAPNGVGVHFKLQAADLEKENVKGDKRVFIPLAAEVSFDSVSDQVVVPFEYRPLSPDEQEKYGKRTPQKAIIQEALEVVPAALGNQEMALAALVSPHEQASDAGSVTYLEHHLRQYTRRNTSDFFIHRDLEGFLARELEFYLKNEVLALDDLVASEGARADGWFQLIRVIRAVGRRIIAFLAQIEGFQKMLFEKGKFVLDTQYCISVGYIPESLYPELAACEPQWQEWSEMSLFGEKEATLGVERGTAPTDERASFLAAHPTLVVDTCHFDRDFTDRLLGMLDDLDDLIDGILVHAENFQALRLLEATYRGRAKCVYLDPPYNSKATEIVYKNTYKHSSWLSLMENRLVLGRELLCPGGMHVIAIDENERDRLCLLLRALFPADDLTVVSVVHNPRGIQGDNFSYCHEYACFVHPPTKGAIESIPIPESDWKYSNLRNWGGESLRSDGRTCFYPIQVKDGQITDLGDVPPDDYHPRGQNISMPDGTVEVWPIDRNGIERKWRYAARSLEQVLNTTRLIEEDDKIEIEIARSVEKRKTVWVGPQYDAGTHGTRLLSDILDGDFSFPKSLYTVIECLEAAGCGDGDIVVDYFAGSGTTGHAVISMNRADGARRKFVMVEMADYFDSVLLPRLKKVAFSPEWSSREPKRVATPTEAQRGPRVLKVIRLESYEDALSNIALADSRSSLLSTDDYALRYMLNWETRQSATLLNIDELASPFGYAVDVVEGQGARREIADLPETFAYMLGLRVRSRQVVHDGPRRYLVHRGTAEGRETAVIWRDVSDWQQPDFERDRDFVAEGNLVGGADQIYVNGDSCIPGAASLDPVFKSLMFRGT